MEENNKQHFDYFSVERTEKGLLAVASTAVEDRHGEVVEVSGWDLKNFKKNPILLWGHEHSIPAIGTAKNIRIEGEGKKARLMFEPKFHEATDFAKAIKFLYEGDDENDPVLNSFSVGFMPQDMDGNRYTKQELLEISAVNVPANAEARVVARKGLEQNGFGEDVVKQLGLAQQPEDDVRSQLAVVRQQMADINDLNEKLTSELADVVKGLQHLNPRVEKQETAVIRVTLAKVISRATDKALEGKPRQSELAALRVIKRASDRLSHDLKRDLQSGKNIRPS